MNPGRELDALIAEKVMGLGAHCGTQHTSTENQYIEALKFEIGYPNCVYCKKLLPTSYSTDIFAAWQVVEKLISDGFDFRVEWDERIFKNSWTAFFIKRKRTFQLTPYKSAPLAICLAALKAVDYEF